MKRRGQQRPIRPTIYLIAEDKTGQFVLKAILSKRGIKADVQLRGKAEGVSSLAREIKELIDTILQQKSGKDCIVVLHDTDDSTQTYREDYYRIEQICQNYKEYVTHLKAIQEIEAWLLADSGLCEWLHISPKACDHLKRPSDTLKRYVNARPGNWKWDKIHQPKILENISADGHKLSESMRIAMQTLLQLSCTQAK